VENPIVSIVVSNFNYGRYLRQCIDSALRQTYSDVQVIVIDDGSTDDSARVIRDYGDLIESVFQCNNGQGSVWNESLSRIRGSWVIFLDSDDRLAPHSAEQVVAATSVSPRIAKIHWPMRLIDADGSPLGIQIPESPLPSGDRVAELIGFGFDRGPNLATSGNAWRTDVIRRALPMPAPQFLIGADTWLLGLAPLFGTVAALDVVCSEYRVHGTNNGAKGSECERAIDILARSMLVFKKVAEELASRGCDADIDRWIQVNPTFLAYRSIIDKCRVHHAAWPETVQERSGGGRLGRA
jgi:glycosyltransferase involved in cell wall biosynthesis